VAVFILFKLISDLTVEAGKTHARDFKSPAVMSELNGAHEIRIMFKNMV
jgi:hypothetical protein